jgi:hypothetical protein
MSQKVCEIRNTRQKKKENSNLRANRTKLRGTQQTTQVDIKTTGL